MKLINMVIFFIVVGLAFATGTFASEMEESVKMPSASMTEEDPEGFLAAGKNLVGLDVTNKQGDLIGKISDQIRDPVSGEINYVIVSMTDPSGESHAVPFQALRLLEEENKVALQIDEKKLIDAPKQQATMTNEEFNREIHKYYGLTPKWEGKPESSKE